MLKLYNCCIIVEPSNLPIFKCTVIFTKHRISRSTFTGTVDVSLSGIANSQWYQKISLFFQLKNLSFSSLACGFMQLRKMKELTEFNPFLIRKRQHRPIIILLRGIGRNSLARNCAQEISNYVGNPSCK